MSSAFEEEADMTVPGQQYHSFEGVPFMDIQRRPKFSQEELEAMVTGITTHRDVLVPPNGAPSYRSTNASRQNSWKDIVAKINAVSEPEVTRTLPEVVKRWRYLKSRTRVKARRLTKWDKSLTDLQKRIVALVGDRKVAQEEDNDEDGWDEVYEVDVSDVTVGEADASEDGIGEPTTPISSRTNPVRYVEGDSNVVNTHPMTQSSTSGHIVNNLTHNASPSVSTPFYQDTVPLRATNGMNAQRSPRIPRSENQPATGIYERAPPIDTNQESCYQRIPSERQADKSNVNITVQSCSCHGNTSSRSTEEQRLGMEKERLEIERQRLEVEKARLAIEQERLEMEKRRIAAESGAGAKTET